MGKVEIFQTRKDSERGKGKEVDILMKGQKTSVKGGRLREAAGGREGAGAVYPEPCAFLVEQHIL